MSTKRSTSSSTNRIFSSFAVLIALILTLVSTAAAQGTVPNPPDDLTAAVYDTDTILLQWVNDDSIQRNGSNIYITVNYIGNRQYVGSVSASATAVLVSGLTCGSYYEFEVTSYNSVGESGFGNYAPIPHSCQNDLWGKAKYEGNNQTVYASGATVSNGITSTTADAAGVFHFPNTAPGTYTLTVTHPEYTFPQTQVIMPSDGTGQYVEVNGERLFDFSGEVCSSNTQVAFTFQWNNLIMDFCRTWYYWEKSISGERLHRFPDHFLLQQERDLRGCVVASILQCGCR